MLGYLRFLNFYFLWVFGVPGSGKVPRKFFKDKDPKKTWKVENFKSGTVWKRKIGRTEQ